MFLRLDSRRERSLHNKKQTPVLTKTGWLQPCTFLNPLQGLGTVLATCLVNLHNLHNMLYIAMLIAHASTKACSYKTLLSVNPAMNKTHLGTAQHRAMAGTGTDFGSGDGQLPFCPSFVLSLLLAAITYSIIKPATFQANFQPYSPHTYAPTTTARTPYHHKEKSPGAKFKGRKSWGCPCAPLPPGGAEQC